MSLSIEGKVAGPLCPVKSYPPDPRCQPTEETYKAWPIAVYTSDKKTKVAQIEPLVNGTYKIELPGAIPSPLRSINTAYFSYL